MHPLIILIFIIFNFYSPQSLKLSSNNLKQEYKNDIANYSHGAISSDVPLCSKIGSRILLNGGNAIDAAVATEFCLYVTNIQATSLGGGGKAIIYIKERKMIFSLNFRELSPIYIANISSRENFRRGPLSIGTPGNLMGLYLMWKRFGKMDWKSLIYPSIVLAKRGFRMTKHLHDCTKNVVKLIRKSRSLRKILLENNRIKKVGSIIRNLALANTLQIISKRPLDFYRGKIAKSIVQDVKNGAGILSEEDFIGYKSKWEQPLRTSIRKGLYAFMPNHNSGGPSISFILRMLKYLKIQEIRKTGKLRKFWFYHQMIEVFKIAFGQRSRILTSGNKLYQGKAFKTLISLINDKTTFDYQYYLLKNSPIMKFQEGTSHLNTYDRFGNAVSLTSSINTQLGSYYMSPSTGIILNNQLADFNNMGNKRYKLPPFEGNDLKPGKMPQSSMCPLIVLDQNANVRMITGGSGGPLIITTLIQVLINRFWLGLPYDYSISRWRIHHQLLPNRIQYESHNSPPKKLMVYLQRKGHLFMPIYRCRRSAANSIFVEDRRFGKNILAIGDGRKHGGVGGY